MAYTATTLADLKGHMRTRWDQSVFWTDDEARLAINEALREWNLLTGRWRLRDSSIIYDGITPPAFTLPGTFTFGLRVRVNSQPVHPTSLFELDHGRPSWRLETVSSGGDVPTTTIFFAPRSLSVLELWPAPAGLTFLSVDGIAATPVLVEEGDFVDLGEEIVDVIADFAVHCAAFKEGGPRWKATLPLWQAFLTAAGEENQLLKTKQLYRRYAGLNRTRDLKPIRAGQTALDGVSDGLPALGGG